MAAAAWRQCSSAAGSLAVAAVAAAWRQRWIGGEGSAVEAMAARQCQDMAVAGRKRSGFISGGGGGSGEG